jgi:hypothetical protein
MPTGGGTDWGCAAGGADGKDPSSVSRWLSCSCKPADPRMVAAEIVGLDPPMGALLRLGDAADEAIYAALLIWPRPALPCRGGRSLRAGRSYGFCAQGDCAGGVDPVAGLIMDTERNLYGTTSYGGGIDAAFCPPTVVLLPQARCSS